jgi:hypothetical protein
MCVQEKTIQVQVGVLIRRYLREILESEKFAGRPIRWMETKRRTYSVFHIRGPRKDVSDVEDRVDSWLRSIGASS